MGQKFSDVSAESIASIFSKQPAISSSIISNENK
jgi:hypothetical protein